MNRISSLRLLGGLFAIVSFALLGRACEPTAIAQSSTTPVATTVGGPPATASPMLLTPSATTTGAMPTAVPAVSSTAGDFSGAVRQVAQRVKPAVVQITNEQVQLDQSNQAFTVPAGVGSGVIYDRQGHI